MAATDVFKLYDILSKFLEGYPLWRAICRKKTLSTFQPMPPQQTFPVHLNADDDKKVLVGDPNCFAIFQLCSGK